MAKAHALKTMEDAKLKAEKEKEEREKELKLNQKKMAEEGIEHAKIARASQEAHVKELKMQEALRKAAAEAQTKLFSKVLTEKKSKFAKEFEHVWIGGDTETKMV